uniref:Uncharacterized protein n=1 Tax=Clytia hemisphaerica TaxID=252671 RepID=A0A7M5X7P5_9CNID
MEIEKLKETLVLMEFNMTKIESACQNEIDENEILRNELELSQIVCKQSEDKIEEKDCTIASLEKEKAENAKILQDCLGELESTKHDLNLKKYALEGVIRSNLKLQERIAELESTKPENVHKDVSTKRQIVNEKSPLDERSTKAKQRDEKKKLPFKTWKQRPDTRHRDQPKTSDTDTSEKKTSSSNEKSKKSRYQRKREKKDRKTIPEQKTPQMETKLHN